MIAFDTDVLTELLLLPAAKWVGLYLFDESKGNYLSPSVSSQAKGTRPELESS
jgi:hypothetical protein